MKILKSISLVFAFLVLSFSFFCYSFVGFHTFMMADDYCYFSILQRYDFFSSQISAYTSTAIFAGNRFAATLLSGLVSYIGSKAIPYFPMLTFIGLILTFAFSYKQIVSYFRISTENIIPSFSALFFLFIFLYTAPTPFQNRYWFSGIVAYTFPFIFLMLSIGLIFLSLKKNGEDWKLSMLIFFISLFAMGFSETCAAAFFVFIIFIFLFLTLYCNERNLKPFFISSVGCMIGLALLILSPSAQLRLSSTSSNHINPLFKFIAILLTSLDFSFDFIRLNIIGLYVPLIICGLTFFAVGYFHFQNQKIMISKNNLLVTIAGSILCTFLVIAASMAPTVFKFNSYLNPRSQNVPMFFLILGLSTIAYVSGGYLSQKKLNFVSIGYILLLVVSIYVIRCSIINIGFTEILSPAQNQWALRDLQIRAAVSIGVDNLSIHRIDRIEKVTDFNPICFLEYYHLEYVDYLN